MLRITNSRRLFLLFQLLDHTTRIVGIIFCILEWSSCICMLLFGFEGNGETYEHYPLENRSFISIIKEYNMVKCAQRLLRQA